MITRICLLVLALSTLALAQDAPRQTVDEFYASYRKQSNLQKFIAQSGRFLDPGLHRLLQDLADNQPGVDEAWLDFDPFINGQMEATSIRTTASRIESGKAVVPVYVQYGGRGEDQLAAEVILRRGGPGWFITNFRYPARDGMNAWNLKDWLTRQLK